MSQNINYFGTTRVIPETPETGWGQEETNFNLDTIRAVGGDNGISWLISNVPVLVEKSTNNLNLGASATITQATPVHILSGSGAVTLNGTTAITNGVTHGQRIKLMGADTITTNTVTVPDAANVRLNGNMILAAFSVLELWWNNTLGDWVESSRKD